MLLLIKLLLLQIVDNIDNGSSNMTTELEKEIVSVLKLYTDTTQLYSRTQAAKYLNCSIQSFDLYRKEGKIKPGKKLPGGVQLWTKLLLDEYISKFKK